MKKQVLATILVLILSVTNSLAGDPPFEPALNYAVGDEPCAVFPADLDGDGHYDLVTANSYSDNVSILMNNGDGTYAESVQFSAGDYPNSVYSADFDRDGDFDLAVTNSYSENVSVLMNDGDGTFAGPIDYSTDSGARWVVAVDFNSDGDCDMAVANYLANTVSILKNNGDGSFSDAISLTCVGNPVCMCSGDFDGDGDFDLATANKGTDNASVFLNNGDGTFVLDANYATGEHAGSICGADLDGDGNLDLAVVNPGDDNVSILRNNGDGTFAAAIDYAAGDQAYSVCAADFDDDSHIDLAVANYLDDNVTVLINNGDASFVAPDSYSTGDVAYMVCAADLDSDGDYDLAVANRSADNVSVLFNNAIGPQTQFCEYVILSDDFTGTEIDWTKWELHDSHTCEPHGTVTQNDELIIELPETNNNCGSMGLKSRIDFADYFGDISCEVDFHTTLLCNWQDHPLNYTTPFGAFCYKNYMTRWLVLWIDAAGQEQRYVFAVEPITEKMYHLKVEVDGGVLKFWRGIDDGEYKLVHSVPAGQFQHMPITNVNISQSDRGLGYFDNVMVKGMCPPEAVCQDITIAADDNCQGSGSVDAGSYDPGGRPITVTQVPEGPYPLGQTPVTLTVANDLGHSSTCNATVTVVDLTPPTIAYPDDITAPCASSDGAAVVYEVTSSDFCDPAPQLTCVPPSGSIFPIGDTKVKCVATDNAGNKDSCSFTVTVLEGLGAVAGYVTSNCNGQTLPLMGVLVDIFDSEGLLQASMATAEDGGYEFADLPSGQDYTVNLVTPLGYEAEAEEIPTWVGCNDNVTADFNLTCLELVGRLRGIGYWKHEVAVALGGDGHEELSPELICGYLDMIADHFNSNEINQVLLYDPPESEHCTDKLNVASALLNLRGDVGVRIRAQQNLMAVLFNVAAGNIFQKDIISEDGATVSQAITFCDYLIDDPEGDHNLVIIICNEINHSRTIEADVIPLTTIDIAYHVGSGGLPSEFELRQNYPNPFNPVTEICFALPQSCNVKLEIFNIVGQKVTTLVDGTMPAGHHTAQWDGGTSAASGFYMYRLTAGDFVETKKMMMIK